MKEFLTILITIGLLIPIWFLLGWFVMILWNELMPVIFGLTTLTYQQSMGLLILCSLLFGKPNIPSNSDK